MPSITHQESKKINLPFVFPRSCFHPRHTHFQPRPEITSKLEMFLLPSQLEPPNTNIPLTFILTGLGGVGKTMVARDFCITHRDEFDVIIFLVADRRERLSQQYSEVAQSLGLIDASQTQETGSDREKLKLWFEHPVKVLGEPIEVLERPMEKSQDRAKWLLILDNADDPHILKDFWPTNGFGSVLVTSRDPATRIVHYPHSEGWDLGGFPDTQAVEFLRTITHSHGEAEETLNAASKIVQRLDGIPLAIDQIGSIIMYRNLSLSEFVKDYTRASDFHELYDERHNMQGYEHNLGSVWAFDSLEADDMVAFSLLSVLAMLDPACVQEEVILKSLEKNATNRYPRTKREYNDTLARLIKRSMVQKDRDDGSLQLHRLVQDVARARLAKSKCIGDFDFAFNLAFNSVAECFPFRDEEMNTAGSIKRWKQCRAMYGHIVQLSQVTTELLDIPGNMAPSLDLVDLLYEAAWYVCYTSNGTQVLTLSGRWQCERGEVSEALPIVDLCSTICDLHSPPQQPQDDVRRCRTPLQMRQTKIWACKIVIAQTVGDYQTAFQYSRLRFEAADNEYQATGELTPFLTATYNTLGQAYGMNRLCEKALLYLDKSVEFRRQMPNFQKDWLFSPYYHMGVVHHSTGNFDEAAKILQEAIADREEALGPNDRVSSRTGALYYVLGNVRNSQGFRDEAYSLHQRALMQCRQTAGESAIATLRCSQKVAEHYERYGYDSEAR